MFENCAIVGHIPRKFSQPVHFFYTKIEASFCVLIPGKGNIWQIADLSQEGLKVPCELTFQGDLIYVTKIKKLLSITPPPTNDPKPDELQSPSKKRKVQSNGIIDVEYMNLTRDHLADPVLCLSLNNITQMEEDREIVLFGII